MQENSTAEYAKKYAEYVDTHTEEIAKKVDIAFEEQKENIKEKIFDWIANCFDENGACNQYKWYKDYCPWDFSGEVKLDGSVSLEQTIEEFLRDEYTGQWEASYTSHYGKNWKTYGDDLSYATLDIGWDIMLGAIKKAVEEEFKTTLSDNDMSCIRDECDFDSVYDECRANEFFCWEGAVEFVDIRDIELRDLLLSRGFKCETE